VHPDDLAQVTLIEEEVGLAAEVPGERLDVSFPFLVGL